MNPIQGDILFKLFQQVNVRIWYYDTATDRICYVASDGTTEEAIPFDEHMSMKHPDDCAQVYESMEFMAKYRKAYPEPLMIRYRDNNQPDGYRYTLNAIAPVFKGRTFSVIGSEQDITAMVRKQQLAEKQAQIIEELLRRHRDDTYTITPKADKVQITHSDGTELVLTIDQLLKVIDETESVAAMESLDAVKRGESKLMEFHLKEKEPRKDGYRHYIRCTALPSKYDYKGNVLEYNGVGTDITMEIADKRRLKNALAEAKEQSRKKSVFVARATHDLRNPLNAMLNLAEMMCMDISLDERKEMCELMKQSGEALQGLINDILDLSRIESGIQINKTPFDVKEAVADIIHSFEISSGGSHPIILQTDLSQRVVVNDSLRVSQIVSNFLSNAIKYSPAGNEVVVTLRSTAQELYIAVTDHGCGISDDDKPHVFDEFARFNTEVSGTGLGLSICKRIAESLGGTIGFDSQEGVGSTFWVKL